MRDSLHRTLAQKVEQAGSLLDRDETAEAIAVLEDLRQQVRDLAEEGYGSPVRSRSPDDCRRIDFG